MIRIHGRRQSCLGRSSLTTSRHRLLGGAALMIATLSPAIAQAQDAEPAVAGSLGDIVVTAQHRKENVQTTPIAVSVHDGDDLRNKGVADVQSLSAMAPDVGFSQSQGNPIITIRGISSRDTTENGDPAVTVSTDGFYVNRPYALNATLFDLDRIEVLRGPQGTLSGRNSVGGAVNVITAKPTDKFEGYASVAYGNYNDLETQGAINVPLSDTIQVRASFFNEKHDGYRNNGIGGSTDDADKTSVRLQLAFQPTDRLSGNITGQYTRLGGQGDGMQNVPFVYADDGSLVHAKPDGINSKDFLLKTQPSLRLTQKQVRGNLTYDLGGVDVTLLGGYDETHWAHADDQSSLVDDSSVYQFQQNQWPKTLNGELRFTSTTDGPFQWQAGAFYFQEHSHLLSVDAAPLTTGGYDYYFGFAYRTKAESKAVYAQASYQLTPTIKVTGGARYTHDRKRETGYYGNISAGVVYANQEGGMSSSKPTFHVEVEDALTPENFVYAKFDTGYKAGGFNFGGTSYKPETIKSWEIGSKNRFLDNTLQLNLAAYYSDYTNQQVSGFAELFEGESVQLTQNAGSSEIYGVEADLIYDLPSVARLNLTVNYLHARYTDFSSIPDSADPNPSADDYPGGFESDGNVQLKGNRPPQSPSWSIAAGLEHDWSIFGGTLTGRVQTKFQSASNFSFYNFDNMRQGAYAMSDAFLTYRPDAAQWSVTGYVKNFTNGTVLSNAEESLYASAYRYSFYAPRTYGVRLQYNW